jgi:hypothetical protein
MRSGSTLVYNIAKALRSSGGVIKTHAVCSVPLKRQVILSYRDPRDCVVSLWRAQVKPDPERVMEIEDFEAQCRESLTVRQSADAVIAYETLFPTSRVLRVRYEEFYSNLDLLIDRIAAFLKVAVTVDEKIRLNDRFGLRNSTKICERLDGFAHVDPETALHGNHIGFVHPGQFQRTASPALQRHLTREFSDLLLRWGYVC